VGENGFQIGLRAEQTISKGELISTQAKKQYRKRNYTIISSTGLTYNPNQTMLGDQLQQAH
jgi:hypothetical protein